MSRTAPRQIIWIAIILAVAAALWYRERPQPAAPVLSRAPAGAGIIEEDHFSPEENLEQLDLAQIENAHRSLDVAMYAFTDRYLADAIVRAARRGVQVRIYRDHGEYEDEQHKAGQHGTESTTTMFQGEHNVRVRVKRSRELMHLKAYCVDGALLRDGSANWSPGGLKRQDNNLRFTTDPRQVRAFQRQFDEMWTRDNEVVQ